MWQIYEEIFELLLINIIQNRVLAFFLDEISTEKGKHRPQKNNVESDITIHLYAPWKDREYRQGHHQ